MSNDARIGELLEAILESDRAVEEVCSDCPELLDEVRERLKRIRGLQARIDSLFPLTAVLTSPIHTLSHRAEGDVPSIHGYELLEILGRGGMGIVYQARHLKLNRIVALKMLLAGSHASEQEQARFAREAEAIAGLRHPNVVQIYELGEVAGQPYFTMEYVAGGSLAAKLAGARQSVRDSAQMIATLAQAVFAAHQNGIIHRDLKPANILLAENGTPKVSDFGLARRLDTDDGLTRTGVRLGTPNYMAPEQMAGQSASMGPSVDIFALGAMLYEMLTGRPPFQGESLSETERKLTREEPTRPSHLNPKVPRDLETICLRCLEKEPRGRYATAGDLAADLERFLRHEPIHARPVAPLERGVRWIRRNPLPTALAVTSIVLVALIASQVLQDWAQAAAGHAEKARLTSRFESGVQLVQEGRFAEARAILGKLGDGGFADLRWRIDRVLSDLKLVEELEAIGVKRAMALNARDATWRPNSQAAKEYEALFARTGFGKMVDEPASIAKRAGASDIKYALLAGLDDWAVCETDEARRNWVLEVARRADGDQQDWRTQCRDPALWSDRAELTRLAESALAAKPSVQQLRALGDRLDAAGLDAATFRSRVQQDHVDSFLANLSLADALRPTDPAEAIRYYQAALAIHPQSATARNNLAVALVRLGRSDEAVVQYQQSLKLDPNSAPVQYNLGLALLGQHPTEALRHLRRATELNANFAIAHRTLGERYLRDNRHSDAATSFRRCLALLGDTDVDRDQIIELLRSCEAQHPNGTR